LGKEENISAVICVLECKTKYCWCTM